MGRVVFRARILLVAAVLILFCYPFFTSPKKRVQVLLGPGSFLNIADESSVQRIQGKQLAGRIPWSEFNARECRPYSKSFVCQMSNVWITDDYGIRVVTKAADSMMMMIKDMRERFLWEGMMLTKQSVGQLTNIVVLEGPTFYSNCRNGFNANPTHFALGWFQLMHNAVIQLKIRNVVMHMCEHFTSFPLAKALWQLIESDLNSRGLESLNIVSLYGGVRRTYHHPPSNGPQQPHIFVKDMRLLSQSDRQMYDILRGEPLARVRRQVFRAYPQVSETAFFASRKTEQCPIETNSPAFCRRHFRVGIWRRSAQGNGMRRIANEDQVVHAVQRFVHRNVTFHTATSNTPVSEQIAHWNGPDVMISTLGSHQFMLLFSSGHTGVLEISGVHKKGRHTDQQGMAHFVESTGHQALNSDGTVDHATTKWLFDCRGKRSQQCTWEDRLLRVPAWKVDVEAFVADFQELLSILENDRPSNWCCKSFVDT